MLDSALTDRPTAEQRRRATAAVQRHARDSHDEADLMAMLGLDQEPAPPPPAHRAPGPLSAAELFELFAPLVAERAEALAH